MAGRPSAQAVYVWDLPLRAFHWLLVASLVAGYVTGTAGGLWLDWHARLGAFTLSLVVFRLVWGFVGSTHARFAGFAPTPRRLRRFFASRPSGVGHNPFAGLWIFALLALVLVQSGTGLFAVNDEIDFYGPLSAAVASAWSERLTGWHAQLVNVLIALIGLHLVAIAYHALVKRENLVGAMITGSTAAAGRSSTDAMHGGGAKRFLLAAGIAAGVFGCIESGLLSRLLASGAS